jgi:hypothetical protein
LAPKELAKYILQHELISDSTFSRAGNMWFVGSLVQRLEDSWPGSWFIPRWRYATAIRPEELVRILQDRIASLPANQAGILTNLLAAPDPESDRKLQMLNAALRAITPPPPVAAGQADRVPNYAVQVDKIFQQVTDTAQEAVGKLETWFSSTMDRVAQRFVVQLRIWTVAFAFLLAFAAHLDSLRLLDQLSSNPETRKALVNMRKEMLSQADTLRAAPAVADASEVPISKQLLDEALAVMNKTNPSIPKSVPDGTTTVNDAAAWLVKQPGVPASADALYRETMIGVLRQHAVTIGDSLVKAGVQLIPSPYRVGFDSFQDFLGVLLTAAFLGLGAPFWYNALKNLSNLRTVVASKQDQESS